MLKCLINKYGKDTREPRFHLMKRPSCPSFHITALLNISAVCSVNSARNDCAVHMWRRLQSARWVKLNAVYVSRPIIRALQRAASADTKFCQVYSLPSCFDQYNRRVQSACGVRRCYSEGWLLSPLNSGDKDIIRFLSLCTVCGGPATPVLLTKASFSVGDNGVSLKEFCCNWVLMKVAGRGVWGGVPNVWSVSSGRPSVVQAASVSVF